MEQLMWMAVGASILVCSVVASRAVISWLNNRIVEKTSDGLSWQKARIGKLESDMEAMNEKLKARNLVRREMDEEIRANKRRIEEIEEAVAIRVRGFDQFIESHAPLEGRVMRVENDHKSTVKAIHDLNNDILILKADKHMSDWHKKHIMIEIEAKTPVHSAADKGSTVRRVLNIGETSTLKEIRSLSGVTWARIGDNEWIYKGWRISDRS